MTPAPVTLITGGSSGIGAATASQLLDRGHRVAVTGRNPDRLDKFADGLGRPASLLTVPGDAADYDAVRAAVESTVTAFGRLDNAVANAGFVTAGGFPDGDPHEWRDMVLTNVLGPALLVKAALPALTESRGRIVFLGSIAGLIHTPGNLYGATKWAVTGLAENTRLRVTGDGVGVTLINPSATDTNFFDPLGGKEDRPGGYLTADNLAAAIVWAISQPPGVDVNTVTVRPVGSPR
jgi:NADP-dependent 3-hydroxy acid dehydrogenase YdfG